MIRTAILGASGYVGGELLRLLAAHPQLVPAKLFGDSKAGQASRHRSSAPGACLSRMRSSSGSTKAYSTGSISCSRHCRMGTARRSLRTILDSGIPFVDLGADFRLGRRERPTSAGTAMRTKRQSCLASSSTAFRSSIAKPSAAQRRSQRRAATRLRPSSRSSRLVDAGLIEPESLIVDAASGVSGAGREAKEATGFSTVDGSFSAYGLLNHRHTAEMEMALGGDRAVHAAPRADDSRHSRDLLRRRRQGRVRPARALASRL